jgi:chitinase
VPAVPVAFPALLPTYAFPVFYPAEKLVLVFPFYGRMWEGVHVSDDGFCQRAYIIGMIIPCKRICGLDTISWENHWDASASGPYLWSPEAQEFISYESPASIGLKVDYIKEQGMSGAMFWEYSDDPDQQLLDALYTGLNEE